MLMQYEKPAIKDQLKLEGSLIGDHQLGRGSGRTRPTFD
jgi:hypothetical protein